MCSYMWYMHVWGWLNHVYMFIRVCVFGICMCVWVWYNHVDMFRCACICGIWYKHVYMFIRVCVCGVSGGWRSCWVCFPIAHILFLRQSLTELILPIQGALGSPISRVMGTCYHAQLSWGAWRLDLSTSLMDPPAQCPVP